MSRGLIVLYYFGKGIIRTREQFMEDALYITQQRSCTVGLRIPGHRVHRNLSFYLFPLMPSSVYSVQKVDFGLYVQLHSVPQESDICIASEKPLMFLCQNLLRSWGARISHWQWFSNPLSHFLIPMSPKSSSPHLATEPLLFISFFYFQQTYCLYYLHQHSFRIVIEQITQNDRMFHIPPLPSKHLFTLSLTSSNHRSFSVSTVLPFPDCGVVVNIQNVAFADCLLSYSDVQLRLLCICSWLNSSFPHQDLLNSH